MIAIGPTKADRRLLPDARIAGPMPWAIAIMMFLMVLTAAGGLAMRHAALAMGADLADRITIQIVEAEASAREAQAQAVLASLRRDPGIVSVRRVPAREMRALLAPWLGEGGLEDELPLPVLIDAVLVSDRARDAAALESSLRTVAPAARVDEHARALAPLAGLIAALKWLALALVLLMAMAAAAVVMLASRAALDTHRPTIDVMHLLGATDVQIARLFQRRLAMDALLGGLVGLVAAATVILLIGRRIGSIGSELLGSAALPPFAWLLLLGLPWLGAAVAMLTTRLTVLSALRRIL
ncbi:MAG: cell division protein [Sphingomonas bacterium]|jgi:cell division transport system permease protein|nr:cell division protein [Sphingomonas bacterium]